MKRLANKKPFATLFRPSWAELLDTSFGERVDLFFWDLGRTEGGSMSRGTQRGLGPVNMKLNYWKTAQ